MKNIKDITQGTYIDELNIDGLDEKKSINSNANVIANGTSNNEVISIGTVKEIVTINNTTEHASIV